MVHLITKINRALVHIATYTTLTSVTPCGLIPQQKNIKIQEILKHRKNV